MGMVYGLVFLLLFNFYFFKTGSHYVTLSGCPRIHCVNETGLEFTEIPSAGVKGMHTTPIWFGHLKSQSLPMLHLLQQGQLNIQVPKSGAFGVPSVAQLTGPRYESRVQEVAS